MQTNDNIYTRTEMLLGKEGVERLRASRVIIFGVGGVGGYATEALARAGVGNITLVDFDRVSVSNLNRQIIATHSTVGMYKTEAMRDRILDINPSAAVTAVTAEYTEETSTDFKLGEYDLVLDCIDSVRSKISLIAAAKAAGVPIISSMGAGSKLDPTRFRVADISKTHTDPLAKAVRTGLRKLGITSLTVVFSDEEPIRRDGERTVGSVSFVPSAAGLVMASEAVRMLTE
ncbi:MAG: tRNA threonylcarbamoyladenosine dehydratase [Clostridia bacterium]|nr:tRNA threonylcarbamoyladenosine dehydratase [Clostridia bacterium]